MANGVVYATTLSGQVYALDDFGVDGVSTRWISSLGSEEGFGGAYGSPAVGRYLYVSGIDGFLYAFDGSGGAGAVQVAWRQPQFETEEMPPVVGGPGLDEAGGIIAVGSEDGGLYAYNALDRREPPLVSFPHRRQGLVDSRAAQRGGLFRLAGRQRLRRQHGNRGAGLAFRHRRRRRGHSPGSQKPS